MRNRVDGVKGLLTLPRTPDAAVVRPEVLRFHKLVKCSVGSRGRGYLLANRLLLGERLREYTKGDGEARHDNCRRVNDVDSYAQCKTSNV